MKNTLKLDKEAKAWIRRSEGQNEIIRIVPDLTDTVNTLCYQLYLAYELRPDSIGKILFDKNGYWIYDGEVLTIAEQEQVACFIINYES